MPIVREAIIEGLCERKPHFSLVLESVRVMPFVVLIQLLLLASYTAQPSQCTEVGCVGEKGEQGVPGVPGPPGRQGPVGEQGAPGIAGSSGLKGEAGVEGPVGPPGKQGPEGVIGPAGPPGPQGPPGKTGTMGPPGPRGPTGQTGGRGEKGQRGLLGPRGLAGLDGVPGTAGPIGPPGGRGAPGAKGNIGLPGAKGEAGPQGRPGPEMSEDLLKEYFAPVKNVTERVTQLENETKQLSDDLLKHYFALVRNMSEQMGQLKNQIEQNRLVVAAHLDGSSHNYYLISSVITYWSPSFLLGGITYNNGALTVPSDGIYYIYAHLYVHERSNSYITPSIRVNGSNKLYMTSYYNSGQEKTKHGALLQQLRKGDLVHIYGGGYRHFMGPQHSAFGVYKIQ